VGALCPFGISEPLEFNHKKESAKADAFVTLLVRLLAKWVDVGGYFI
jgi:hypothetical protein